jgi:predicted DCC family thiol-disulfide oxidoreductase YuxK
MNTISTNMPIVFFDGVCNLCNGSVQWIIKRDNKNIFHFAALQSVTAEQLLGKNAMQQFNGVVLLLNNKLYTKSTAALHIVKDLGFPYALLYAFIIVPRVIRNAVYNFIGKNRYKWFGKSVSCYMPTSALKAKFLE